MQKLKSNENKTVELLKINLKLKTSPAIYSNYKLMIQWNGILQNQAYQNQAQITKHTLRYNGICTRLQNAHSK